MCHELGSWEATMSLRAAEGIREASPWRHNLLITMDPLGQGGRFPQGRFAVVRISATYASREASSQRH